MIVGATYQYILVPGPDSHHPGDLIRKDGADWEVLHGVAWDGLDPVQYSAFCRLVIAGQDPEPPRDLKPGQVISVYDVNGTPVTERITWGGGQTIVDHKGR